MSVKHAMLALLAAAPSSTYQLRKRFDASTGQGLPLNIGQVSSTLQRLERDGMVTRDGSLTGDSDAGDGTLAASDTQATGDGAGAGQLWRLRQAGRDELASWWASPVLAEQRGRDELVMKLALAIVTPGVDVPALLQSQRAATQRTMHDLTRVRRDVARDDIVGRLVVDHHIFTAEAELRWLDDAEAALQRAALQGADLQHAALAGTPTSTDETITAQPTPLAKRVEGTR